MQWVYLAIGTFHIHITILCTLATTHQMMPITMMWRYVYCWCVLFSWGWNLRRGPTSSRRKFSIPTCPKEGLKHEAWSSVWYILLEKQRKTNDTQGPLEPKLTAEVSSSSLRTVLMEMRNTVKWLYSCLSPLVLGRWLLKYLPQYVALMFCFSWIAHFDTGRKSLIFSY